jgi:peroxiredoxin
MSTDSNSLADAFRKADLLIGSLNKKLTSYRQESHRIRPDVARAYDGLVERLRVLDRDQVGPQIGDRMPEFVLPDEDGRLISLSSLCASGPAVISFNRGHWCPYCKLELRSLAAIHLEASRLGAHIVSIMPDSAQFTQSAVKQNDLPFPILSDIDLSYALTLGLIFWVGEEIRRLYEELGIELELYHRNQSYFLPMAAKFVVGTDKLVKARQVNIEFRQRMEPSAIVETLRDLRR